MGVGAVEAAAGRLVGVTGDRCPPLGVHGVAAHLFGVGGRCLEHEHAVPGTAQPVHFAVESEARETRRNGSPGVKPYVAPGNRHR